MSGVISFPGIVDPIEEEMTEEERRAFLQSVIEELEESGISSGLGVIGDLDNEGTKELAERAARMIEEAEQKRHINLFNDGTKMHSISERFRRRMGGGSDGAFAESFAAERARKALQEFAAMDPNQSYTSAKQVFESASKYAKAAGTFGTIIDSSIALYSGDSNKVMRSITSMAMGALAALLAAGVAAAFISGAGVVAVVAIAAVATVSGYFGGQAGEWIWDNGFGEWINDFLDKRGWKNYVDEFFKGIGDYLKDLVDKASNAISDLWDRAKNWLRRSDPLVLDLDGDGIELVAADGTVLFDHDGNRVAEATGWVAPDDGFLVITKTAMV